MNDTTEQGATPKKSKTADKPVDTVTLRDLCAELKLDAYEARQKLRAAVKAKKLKHTSRAPWEWAKGSAALKVAREVLEAES